MSKFYFQKSSAQDLRGGRFAAFQKKDVIFENIVYYIEKECLRDMKTAPRIIAMSVKVNNRLLTCQFFRRHGM